MLMPPSPWIGSTRMAQVSFSMAFAAAGPRRQRLGQQSRWRGVPGVRHMDQLSDLLLHRRHDARRTVAEQAAAPAGEVVEVAIPLRVPDVRALAAHQADGIARVVAD